jgi:glycogen debranching enzyme
MTQFDLPLEPGTDDHGDGLRHIEVQPAEWLVRLRPRDALVYATQGRTVLATARDGFITDVGEEGLWVYQTRMLSRYQWLIDGQPPQMTSNSNVQQHSWLGYYIASPPGIKDEGHDETNPAQQTIELRLSRAVGDGMHEDVDITNFSRGAVQLKLELEIAADFADHSEARSGHREQKGELRQEWRTEEQRRTVELLFDYQVQHRYAHQEDQGVAKLHRALVVRIESANSTPHYAHGRIAFDVELEPHQNWHACLSFLPHIYDVPRPGADSQERFGAQYPCYAFFGRHNEWDERRGTFLTEATRVRAGGTGTLEHVVSAAVERGRRDLASLRLYDLDEGPRAWVCAAGLPIYVGLFGRDCLATAWEASLLGPEMMEGALSTLPRWQGDRIDDWRDEQPGKLPHEAHTGPLSALNYQPHGLYYGGVTGALYYPTVVAGLWHWTGNKSLVRRFVRPALLGLEWADKYGDLDGDGFYEYQTRSEQGERNQGWKDSGDAIVYDDGSIVDTPLGTCEMQAFAYVSKLHFAEVLWWLDLHEEARRLLHEAEELKKHFNEVFWMEGEQYVAMALDPQKRPVRSIASDPGHCLASGILDTARAEAVAARLMSPEMFSGWGIRTLSAEHTAFNPYAYHRGTIWPVENGVFALAFARYGMHDRVNTLCRGMFEATSLYDYYRLPECFAGHTRDERHPFPGAYPDANWPQAWSSSAVISMLQAMLGLYPYAPLHTLLLDPWLPEWLPDVTVHDLRVGEAVATLRFRRQRDGTTEYEVLNKEGHLHIIRQPSPWSVTAGYGERVKDAVESLLPGR